MKISKSAFSISVLQDVTMAPMASLGDVTATTIGLDNELRSMYSKCTNRTVYRGEMVCICIYNYYYNLSKQEERTL
jgi:hypothetical protein